MVVRVYVWRKELGKEVGLLVWCRWEVFGIGIGTVICQSGVGRDFEAFLIRHRATIGVAVFESEKGFFFHLK